MLTFVRLVFTVIRYVLFQSGLTQLINLTTIKERREMPEFDLKSQNSFASARRSTVDVVKGFQYASICKDSQFKQFNGT